MKPLQYITIILFSLASLLVGGIGCEHGRNAVQWVHDNKGVWHPQANVTDSSYDMPFPIMVVHDTVRIYDTVFIPHIQMQKHLPRPVMTTGPNSPAIISNGNVKINYQ